MSAPQVIALQQIDTATRELEALLLQELNKKLEGTPNASVSSTSSTYKELISETFDTLIDLHNTAYATTTESKSATANAKQEMNEKRVELQDVMYERRHILEEIVQCREFRSVYQDVELIPLEEFKEKAGPEYLVDLENSHQLMINRLKYELLVRTELKEQKEALEVERTQLIKENRRIQKKVDQFDKLLDDFVLSAAPVEEALLLANKESMELEDAMEISNTMEISSTQEDHMEIVPSTQEQMDVTLG